MPDTVTREHGLQLRNRATRADAARGLALELGVEIVLLFVRDPALGMLIPAPGMPQTLHGGRTWRSFIKRCAAPGRHEGEVDLEALQRGAVAIVVDGTALILIGGKAVPSELAIIENMLPLLAATLAAEQDAVLARAEAAAAREATDRAQTLAAGLEAARAEASRLNAELRNEQRRKDEFLAMLGHELRNPLAPLVTSIELLRRHGLEGDARKTLLDVMGRQTDQLARLVDDLLDVSRVSRGRIALLREPIVLREVLEHAVDESRPLLEAQQHTLEISFDDEGLTVNADRVRLAQVFGNLLNNASKYTERGGRLALSIQRDGDEAVIRLRDNGIGISADVLPRIFDLFTQAPVSLDRSQGGLGIGLTLVRTLVELHGGRVTAESEGAGKGSTFCVRLPLTTHAVISAAAQQEPTRRCAPPAALKVLIVDDNQDAAQSVAQLIRLLGHHIEVAHDGETALTLAPAFEPDLVLLDIGLPGMDGYQVVRLLKPAAKRGTRFVALTGYGTEESRRQSREAGFDEHVVKPVSVHALENILSRATHETSLPLAS